MTKLWGEEPKDSFPYKPQEHRMTMRQAKKSFWMKVEHFFLRFNMCKCTEPKYEILGGILCCNNCRKPTTWEAKP